MVFKQLRKGVIMEEEEYNSIYPENIRQLSGKHWTPVSVAKIAAEYLAAGSGTKVLDIGSGVGKFCMIGSALTEGHFTGVEYREELCNLSNELARKYDLANIEFIHSNITGIDFKEYQAFYFFNSFIEHMSESEVMDSSVPVSPQLYGKYNQYLRMQFAGMPVGTRLATYWGNSEEVPRGYVVQATAFEGELKMWEKLF